MFQLDGGVQLTSITGSPAEAISVKSSMQSERGDSPTPSEATCRDSLMSTDTDEDRGEHGDISRDSIFGASTHPGDTSMEDSIFGNDTSTISERESRKQIKKEPSNRQFFLRPLSEISTATSGSENDTFVNFSQWRRGGGKEGVEEKEKEVIRKVAAEKCLEADGEDTMMSEWSFLMMSTCASLVSSDTSFLPHLIQKDAEGKAR